MFLLTASKTVIFRQDLCEFVMVKYLLRGMHMIEAFTGNTKERREFLNDTIDADMFLRAGN